MKIAYVTTYDSSDIDAWSGSGLNILLALQEAGFHTESIGNIKERKISLFLSMLKKAYYTKLLSRKYHRDREPAVVMDYATQLEKNLSTVDHDVVFSPGTIPIAYLKTDKPIVFWADATFAGMIGYYPEWCNLCDETIKNGNEQEQLALSRCRLAIYASEWAANSAIQNYKVDPSKVKVVPFGANLHSIRTRTEVNKIIKNKSFEFCKLLFIGVDWGRKGGETALAVANELNRRGTSTELHIVGCTPPGGSPEFVINHGFISKKTEEGRRKLAQLFTESHFLIVPSQAECFGLVFTEASSFGLPSLATRTGGIPSAVYDGKNGKLFALDENPDKYCDYIEGLMTSRDEYEKLALSSFEEYSSRLNWSCAGKRVHDLIREYCH
jgi:glycosyltransferase involved in cell wall biosynthesis